MKIVAASIVIALSITTAAEAQSGDGKPAKAEKKLCRTDVPTGSIMPKTICHTAAEWSQIDGVTQATTQRQYNGPTTYDGRYGH